MDIPLVDLSAQYRSLRTDIDAAIQDVLDRAAFIGGSDVASFEAEFAAFVHSSGCVGVGNGTDALYLSLRAAGIGPGDEVIVQTNSFIATAEAVSMTGAKPVFVDVDPETLQIDVNTVDAALTARTVALLPVHLFGHPCDIVALSALASAKGLLLIEDCAQAHGATWVERPVGTFGAAGCFSFYPGKNLGAMGDGGAVVSNDDVLMEAVRRLANHGRSGGKYLHACEGVNSRLDALQAAILSVKLKRLDEWNAARRAVASSYDAALADLPVRLPAPAREAVPVFHLYVVQVDERDKMQKALSDAGIASGIHYPVPLHLQPAYGHLGYRVGSLPVAEAAAVRILSLPMFPEMEESQIGRVTEAIHKHLRTSR